MHEPIRGQPPGTFVIDFMAQALTVGTHLGQVVVDARRAMGILRR
jgi:hypothetical protein